ncbi:MAG: MBL fold metallo-hydrolase, partial [Chloroflexi bacterium]|nr:MBL fold metallo-hydrolase [Chloroflexota bacterium]
GYLAGMDGTKIVRAAITHHHFDHSGNLSWVKENLGSALECHPEGVALLKDRVPEDHLATFTDGDIIDMGGPAKLRVIHTPGHSVDSVCFYLEDEGVLFSGDTILGVGTTTMRDLYDYMNSLDSLLALPNLKAICPGHGPVINDPRERIEEYIRHRNMREQQILKVLDEGEVMTSWDIMMKIYTDIDTRLRRAADGNVQTHLRKLEKEGRLMVEPGVKKDKSADQLEKEALELRERQDNERKAKEEAEKARKAALASQENPPVDEWEVMPKYELLGKASE